MSNDIPNLPNIDIGQDAHASTDSLADLDNKKTITFYQSIPNGKQNVKWHNLIGEGY